MKKKLLLNTGFASMTAKLSCIAVCLVMSTGISFAQFLPQPQTEVTVSTQEKWFNSSQNVTIGGTYTCSRLIGLTVNGVSASIDGTTSLGTWTYSYSGGDVKDSLLTIVLSDYNAFICTYGVDTAYYHLKVDKTLPVKDSVVYSGSPMAYYSAKWIWFKQGTSDSKLTVSFSDTTSGIKDYSYAGNTNTTGVFALNTSSERRYAGFCYVSDNAGNTDSVYIDYCVDGTAPAFVTNEAGKDIIDVIEEGSGLDSIAYSFDKLAWTKFSSDSIPGFLNQDNIYLVAVDHVGNVSDTLSLFTIDNHSLVNAKDSTVIYVLLDSNNEPYLDKAMRHIDQNLFNDNQDISFVVLPESIQSIGKDAFSYSTVKVIMSFAPQAPALDQPFANIDPEAIVLVPEELESVYESSDWNLYFDNDHIMPYATFNDSTVTVDDIKKMLNREAVIEIGRTFYKDGKYNTISLPFTLSAAQLAQSPLAGYTKLLEFTSAKVMNYGKSDETLIINMSNADAIKAGHPYIIEWDSIGDTIANPVFKNVTVTTEYATNMAQLDGAIMFFGTFTPFMVYENDMDFIFIDEKSQLSWPNKTNLFKAFRAYFQINKAKPAGLRSGMNAIFGGDDEEGTTRVLDLNSSADAAKARKLMLEGRVVIEKAGKYFDITGKEIK